MIEQTLKRMAGEVIIGATSPSAGLRRLASPLGMRLNHQWPRSRLASVELANGKLARLAGASENYLTFELHWKGWRYFSPYSILTLQELLRGAAVFYDIGANVGYYSVFAASERADLEIVAFEPNPKNFSLLAANSALNGATIRCVPAAVSDTTGRAVMHLPRSDLSGSLESAFNGDVIDTMDVSTYRLDDYVERHPPRGPMVIKAIVEGHEPKLLRGALRTLDERRPDMILAVSRRYDDETMTRLRERGYACYAITDAGLRPEAHLDVCLDGESLFLEHLVTTKPRASVLAIGERVVERSASVRRRWTNTHRMDLAAKRSIW